MGHNDHNDEHWGEPKQLTKNMILPEEFTTSITNFKTLNREKRRTFLLELIKECDSYDFYTLQQILQRMGMNGFDLVGTLPLELSVKIFSHLDVRDLCTCREVSRAWRNITQDSTIWRLKSFEMFTANGFAPPLASSESWEKIYQELYRRERNWFNGRAQSVRFLIGHKDRIHDAKLKDNILVTASRDRTVCVWDANSGERIQTLNGNACSSVDFLPKEKIIAASTFFRASLIWDMETGELLREFSGHVSAVRVIALNKTYVASCAFDGSLIVWEWQTGDRVVTIPAEASDFRMLDNAIITHSAKEIKVFSLPSGEFLFSTPFDGGIYGWSYFKNGVPSSLIPTIESIQDQIASPASISSLKNFPQTPVYACDIKKGRVVRAVRDHANPCSRLQLLDNYGRSKVIEYPEDPKVKNVLDSQTFTTVDMDCRRIVVGCMNGLVAVFGFDEISNKILV